MARRLLIAVVSAAAVGLLLGGCAASHVMSEADARAYTADVLHDIGLDDVAVSGVQPGFYGTDRVPVWQTESTVEGGRVSLAIERDGRYVLFVRDVAGDGGPLLTPAQVALLEAYDGNPARDRARDRARVPSVVAAGLLVAVTVSLLALAATGRLRAA